MPGKYSLLLGLALSATFSNCAFASEKDEDKHRMTPERSGIIRTKVEFKRREIYTELERERQRQDKKFGSHNNYIPSDWLMVLGEAP